MPEPQVGTNEPLPATTMKGLLMAWKRTVVQQPGATSVSNLEYHLDEVIDDITPELDTPVADLQR